MIHVCQFSYLEDAEPVPHHELGQDRYGFGDFHSYINTCVTTTLKVKFQSINSCLVFDFRSVDRKQRVGTTMMSCMV